MLRRQLLLSACALMVVTSASAAPGHIEEHLPQARVAGKGTFTWFSLAIYDAELWVGEKGYRPDAPFAAPFALDLRYARKLDGVKIADASAEQMEKTGAGTPAQRAQWLAKMKTIFPDVKEGTHISGVFLPGAGARFYLDGKALASVPDQDFARAFFGIWLDPATTARSLRTALLKDAAPR
ncbi:chalcone isomerase family protein [Massilia violaceinigra]|uniref:Chalcone isomerase family protein n=1 Tax=Massilia violaceinigra TaxID=2045208 RepID=A0ABY3ZYV8_9BURK|nr:chalcone isomerase family protein [Massilia violaceinigra]UOD27292.1 chalcone isomerase family protein [Massilia violaceinigra]